MDNQLTIFNAWLLHNERKASCNIKHLKLKLFSSVTYIDSDSSTAAVPWRCEATKGGRRSRGEGGGRVNVGTAPEEQVEREQQAERACRVDRVGEE